MDYGELLYKAQQNERNAGKQDTRSYKTGFAPPKKLERTVSSANIKKFLEKKENEEKRKLEEAKKKKEELLALRNQDKKAKRRVEVMLKRTKSANYSVMEDAIDNNNTAVTLEGPMQCDEDDYGYVSQEASAFYAKIMSKYNSMPAEPSLFSKPKKEVKDLSAAKDRVRAALKKEEEDSELPHKRKRKHKDSEGEVKDKEEEENEDSRDKSKTKSSDKHMDAKPKKKLNLAPPPPSFDQLLKLAEEKKSQPVDIEKLMRDRPKEPDRPMTQKEKIEWKREQERKINRERREKGLPPLPSQFDEKGKPKPPEKPTKFRIPKTGSSESSRPEHESKREEKTESKPLDTHRKPISAASRKPDEKTNDKSKTPISSKRPDERSRPIEKKIPKDDHPISADLDDIDREIELLKRKRMLLEKSKMQAQAQKSEKPKGPSISKPPTKQPEKNRTTESSSKSRPSSVSVSSKPKEQPSKGPPSKFAGAKEVMRPSYLPPMKQKNKPVQKPKRRIDSDSEYDSELDDFIDDGDEDVDYSSCIKEIFGYDKSRYLNDDNDDECMESNFAQISKEEFVSTRIGIMEDLEDIRKEQEEKKRLKMKKMMKMKSGK